MNKLNRLNISIILGVIAIVGILIAQLLWTRQAYNLEEKKFSQKVHVALLEVAKKLYAGTNHELPAENPVQKISNDYYIVNIDNDFEPKILEFYLKSEFAKSDIHTDFEYAMYNCSSDEMVYGNYISFSEDSRKQTSVYFPKHKNLVYYFAIRFPNERSFLFTSLRFWFVLSGALAIILLVYAYSIFTILQQRKYSELQRDFINNMTHEFKTPLSSILIAANYLGTHPNISDDEKLSKYTRIIIDQSDKLNQHIGRILDMAKSDHEPLKLENREIDPAAVIAGVIDNMKLKFPDASINLNTDNHVRIEADIFHFTNIVYNLIDNSIKYSDGTPQITISIVHENSGSKIDFSDKGIGIPEKKLPYIFDRFYRVPMSGTAINGFGLGLYYVKKITDLEGWKIAASNNKNAGVTVSIQIPKAHEA